MVPHLHSSTTTPAKSSHYTQALSGALVAGSWGDKQPVKQPNGSTLLDWSEGIRKWGKHTGGDTAYLELLRNVSLAYHSSRQPGTSTSTQSLPSQSHAQPPSSTSTSAPGVVLDPSTTSNANATGTLTSVPPSSASDQSRETTHTTTTTNTNTTHSFISIPPSQTESESERASGSTSTGSYVHVSGEASAGHGNDNVRNVDAENLLRTSGGVDPGAVDLGLAPPILGVALGSPLGAVGGGDLAGPSSTATTSTNTSTGTTTIATGRNVVEDSASASTIVPSPSPGVGAVAGAGGQVSGNDVPSGAVLLPPSQQVQQSEQQTPFQRNLQPAASTSTATSSSLPAPMSQSAPAASLMPAPTTSTAEYLSSTWLDGDESEQSILSGQIRGGSRDVPEGRDLVKDLGRVGEGARTHGKGVLGRAYLLLLAYYQHVLGDYSASIGTYEKVDWAGEMDTTGHDMGLSLMAQRVDWLRGMVVYGMSLEAVGRIEDALDRYIKAIKMFADIPGLTLPLTETFLVAPPATTKGLTGAKVLPTPAQRHSTRSTPTFGSHREAHRWVSVALTRGSVISAQTTDLNRTLRLTRTYHVMSKMWPTSFRPQQQAFMISLHLRTLHAACRPSNTPHRGGTEWLVCEIPNSVSTQINGSRSQLWSREWLEAIKEGKRLLSETTTFPRAGETNWKVRRFVESCVGIWERSGCGVASGKELVKILWWAIEMTFHSQAILRHLMRLLFVTGQHDDARRVFELYVKLVLKARQTAQPEESLQLRNTTTKEEPLVPHQVEADDVFENDVEEQLVEGDTDRDVEFLEALLLGARLFTQELANPTEAWRYALLASDVVAVGKRHIAKAFKAKVEESKGIIRMAMASEEGDPLTRPTLQAQGLAHLVEAARLAPSSSAVRYHLAYARTEARDIPGALDAIRETIELAPSNVEAWHLLTLLLTASKDWAGALKASQAGIDTWETVEREMAKSQPIEDVGPLDVVPFGVSTRDYALDDEGTEHEQERSHDSQSIIVDRSVLPIAKSSIASSPPPATAATRLANVIQLRMTQAVILEKLHGPDEAMIRQQETFAYFSSRTGYSRPGGYETGSGDGGSVRDLGESYVAVNDARPAGLPDMGESALMSPPRPRQGENSLSRASTQNATGYHVSSAPPSEDEAETKSLSGRKQRFLVRHLHVPGSKKGGHRTTGTPRRPTDMPSTENRPRAVSTGASIRSRGTTPAHSHYHGARPAPPPPPPRDLPSTPPTGRNASETRLLADLWLQSAATFRRSGKIEQALGAIQEAEVMDPSNPEVWVQLGWYYSATENQDLALQATGKALVLAPEYPPAVVRMAELYMARNQADLAHGLLNPLTMGRGWDSAEAWYQLGKVCQAQGGRGERTKECLLFALQLEKGRLCRPLGRVVDRWA